MKTMNDFKGTQGDLYFIKYEGEEWPEKRWSIAVQELGISKALCISPRYATEGEESEANARLFANSKKVLEAAIAAYETLKYEKDVRLRSEFDIELELLEKAINDSL